MPRGKHERRDELSKAVLTMQAEFAEWDRLSDEALTDFEKGLA